MKKALILVLTNFFILTLILLGRPAKAQTTEITGQFLYGLELYVLSEKQQTPDYSTAIYSRTIDENDFITSGLYQNWLQPRLPDNINGYIYLVDSSHTIRNVYLGGGYLEQGQILSYPFEPSIEMKHYNVQLVTLFLLNPVNKILFETPSLDYIVYYDNNDGTTPRIKLIDATSNENDYNRVKLAINGYDTGYNAGYSVGYENGQNNGYNSGYEEGQNNGYSVGYNQGQDDFYNDYYQQIYDDGYEAGLSDRQLGVNTVVNFNQLIHNGNFEDLSYWNANNSTLSIDENTGLVLKSSGSSSYGIIQTIQEVTNENKYLIIFTIKSDINTSIRLRYPYISGFYSVYNYWQTLAYFTIAATTFSNPTSFFLQLQDYEETNNIYIKNIMMFNLTQIYGVGNEPTTKEEFLQDFYSTYYPYTESSMINIGNYNGYLEGYDDAYPLGYDDGKSYQATQQLTSDGWIKNIFTGIGSFLAIEILPGVSIGLIVGIPFIISVAWFVIKMARGGGNS